MKTRHAACLFLSVFPFCLSLAQSPPEVDVSFEESTDGVSWNAGATGLVELSASEVQYRPVISPAGGGASIIGRSISETFPTGDGSVEVTLELSDDLQTWTSISPGTEQVDPKTFVRVRTVGAMSLIANGVFTMGSPDDPEEPGRFPDETQHEVTLTRSIYVQQTEVTKAQWDAVRAQGTALGYTDLVVGRNGFEGDSSGTHPVTEVSWFNAVKWLNLLSELHGLTPCYTNAGVPMRTGFTPPDCDFDASGYRLPTEAEWEYACRAGTTTGFYSGPVTETGLSPLDPNLDLIAWYGGNEFDNTHPVGEKQPNPWGLFDTSGNVYEWCWDWYDSNYGGVAGGAATDPEGPASGAFRLIRGGSFFAEALECRSAYRGNLEPSLGANAIGFRPVRTVVP